MALRFAERACNFAQRDRFVKLWLLPTWLGLGIASLAISVLAFKRIAPWLGDYNGIGIRASAIGPGNVSRALQIGRTIELAARYAPWRADCYPQAIVARVLLGLHKLPSLLALGLKRGPAWGEMQAHAWVFCGNTPITGGEGANEYTVVAVFTSGENAAVHTSRD